MKISVIIPAYNEEENIVSTIKSVIDYFLNKGLIYEIIVVDDGSTDKTASLISAMPEIKLFQFSKNRGKGAAVRQGMRIADGDLKLFMDADNSTKISELDHFLPKINSGYDVIIASRSLKESQIKPQVWFKVLAGKIGNKLIRLMAVPGVLDTQCGFKLFTKEAATLFAKQTINCWGFDFEILFLAKRNNFKILEMPITWINNPGSRVKGSDYFKTFIELIKIRLNDLQRKYD